jgi:hypothetical protein
MLLESIINCSPLTKIIELLPYNIIKSLNNRVQYLLYPIAMLVTYYF